MLKKPERRSKLLARPCLSQKQKSAGNTVGKLYCLRGPCPRNAHFSNMKKLSVFFATLFFLMAVMPAASFEYTQDEIKVRVSREHPQFTVKLKSNPSTGYSWSLSDYNARLIDVISHGYHASREKRPGAFSTEIWTFRVKSTGPQGLKPILLHFVYMRPWELSAQPARQVTVKIFIK
jgi:inhibitor of cysteine peptidase